MSRKYARSFVFMVPVCLLCIFIPSKKVPPADHAFELRAWKTVKLGVGPTTTDGLWQQIEETGFRIGSGAEDLFGQKFTVSVEEQEVNLIVVSVADLGFREGAHLDEIYRRAKELGLRLCPPDTGPQLRLQYPDQSIGERLMIGMEPIPRLGTRHSGVFRVEHNGWGQYLFCKWDYPGCEWNRKDRFVFILPK